MGNPAMPSRGQCEHPQHTTGERATDHYPNLLLKKKNLFMIDPGLELVRLTDKSSFLLYPYTESGQDSKNDINSTKRKPVLHRSSNPCQLIRGIFLYLGVLCLVRESGVLLLLLFSKERKKGALFKSFKGLNLKERSRIRGFGLSRSRG